jgi:hypothetical protein
MIGICGNPLCLCREGPYGSAGEQDATAQEEYDFQAAFSSAVQEFAAKHGIELNEEGE